MAKRREKGDGSIYQRESDGRYVAYARLENGKKKYVYAATRKEVAAKLKKLQKEIADGKVITAKPETVEMYLWNWLEGKTRIKETTYHNYRNAIQMALPHIGPILLTKLTSDHLQKMYVALLIDHRNRSVQLVHIILKMACRDAMKRKKLSSNPCDEIETPKKPGEKKYEATALTYPQCQKLIDTAKGTQLECFVVFTLATAMRRGELLALRWTDIDLDEKTVHVQRTAAYLPDPKTKKHRWVETTPKSESGERVIPLTDFALVALKSHRARQLEQRLQTGSAWIDKNLVFPGKCGDHFANSTIQDQFKKLVRLAEIPDVCIHELRHSSATLLRRRGVDLKTIQKILGHSNYAITANIYE